MSELDPGAKRPDQLSAQPFNSSRPPQTIQAIIKLGMDAAKRFPQPEAHVRLMPYDKVFTDSLTFGTNKVMGAIITASSYGDGKGGYYTVIEAGTGIVLLQGIITYGQVIPLDDVGLIGNLVGE